MSIYINNESFLHCNAPSSLEVAFTGQALFLTFFLHAQVALWLILIQGIWMKVVCVISSPWWDPRMEEAWTPEILHQGKSLGCKKHQDQIVRWVHKKIYSFFFHYRLLHDIEYSSLYYSVGPCCLRIIYI